MKQADDMRDGFEARVTRALEAQPSVVVPVDFAVRVRQALPVRQKRGAVVSVGRIAAVVGSIALAMALFALAPHARPEFTNLAFDMELVVLLELAGIAYWFVGREA
jgi:hypothetical protein